MYFHGHLDLSFNQLSDNLVTSPLQTLTSLEYIYLSNNQFQIPISLKPLFNHSKLKYFYGGTNNILAETEQKFLAPRFQLNGVSLSCCGDVGPFPNFLHYQNELQHVRLSHIKLTGDFPSWLLENNTELRRLELSNNSLSGHFRLPFHASMKLNYLDISKNIFEGHIPVEIGAYLPQLQFLYVSRNSFNGSIPSSIGDMKFLEELDLSNNSLTGVIPESLSLSCSFLKVLNLSNNSLEGQIFSANFKLTKLRNLSNLKEMIMANNHLEGPMPVEFCQLNMPGVLDLSMNSISGTLPSCFGLPWINHVHLSKNRLRGPIPDKLCKSSNLETMDLSNNHLTGNIPNCFGKLSSLSYLVLSYNNLEGEIPIQLCQLDKLSVIALSHNNLSGRIPHCLNVTPHEEIKGYVHEYDFRYDEDMDTSHISHISFPTEEPIQLTTKTISYSYKGRILTYLCRIDLSYNKMTGEISHEMKNFHEIVILNLSYNSLIGPIPPSFSNFKNIESLDLSYNNLSGSIPLQLVDLSFLASFNVSYNNLSGKPPPRTNQFASDFDENSYWGNPFLCGEPLPKKSSIIEVSSNSTEDGEDVGLIDVTSFYVTFTVSYITVLLSIAVVLYINPYRRGAWFYLAEKCINSCFYFVVGNLPKLFGCGNM
ncbi:Leucine-rich repeat - like 10 [Theobroma cacao]|nr:Leucine-rich repeat - like 10 [Theobroma cacao]